MHKRVKQIISGFLAVACSVSFLSFGGITAFAANKAVRYELEDGRTFVGEDHDSQGDTVKIKSGSQFSGGKAIDTLDHQGTGAGAEITPDIPAEGEYTVVLGYSKGRAYPTGKIALYKNEERVDYFALATTAQEAPQPVVDSNAITVTLAPGDKLSIRADTTKTDVVACFDYLDIAPVGDVTSGEFGIYEAEDGVLLLDGMKVVDAPKASSGKSVDGFFSDGPVDGAGVRFPFAAPEDGVYLVTLAYSRINYEIDDDIGLYVNGERRGQVNLQPVGIDDSSYGPSEPVELTLKKGEQITVMVDAAQGDEGRLSLDYMEVQPKKDEPDVPDEPTGGPAFTAAVLRVLAGDTITVPTENLPAGESLTYSSSNDAAATVDASTGKITAIAAGEAIITAAGTKDPSLTFTCLVQVVATEAELAAPVSQYEAEQGELIDGEGGSAGTKPVIKTGSWASGGKWVEVYDAGTGAAVVTTPDIPAAGEYALTMAYGKGSMYPGDAVSVYVDDVKVGEFKMESGHLTENWDTNTIVANLKPGSKVMVRKDAGQNALFRYDYLKVSRVTTVPVRGFTMDEKEVTLANKETYQAKYTLSPAVATDDLVWTSSDPAVATAEGGVLVAKSEGKATITATSRYNAAITGSMELTVVKNDKIVTLASSEMEVLLDKTYPRAMEYTMLPSGNTMDGNTQALSQVKINNTAYTPEIAFEQKGADTAVYTLKIAELDATLVIQAKVEGTILKFDFLEINESADKAKRIFTIELTDQNPVSVSSKEQIASFAGSKMQPDIRKTGDVYQDLTTEAPGAVDKYNYAFISNGKVAAGVRSNAYAMNDGDQGAPSRVLKETVAEGSATRTSLRSGSWVWRRADYTKSFVDYEATYGEAGSLVTNTYEDTPNQGDMPLVYVVLAEDLNDTGTVDWQDAAIRFRDVMKIAIGMDKIPDAVVQRLIMPQAGEGNYPFISSLDETKRVYLNTDGLGQIILDKYHNLGFWGDFSVYDDHLGGLKDFRKFVSDATNEYNGFVGVHSNFTEVFAKTNQFSMESVETTNGGLQPHGKGYKGFGFFLHQCYYADDVWESMSGQRRGSMAMFKADVPDLGFIYSDVFYWNGWRGKRLYEDYEANGLAYFSEWPYISEDDSVWAHWAVEKSYSPASNKGYSSDVARFIFNHTKDRWDNNASKCDGERVPSACNLLMGADTTSYEGWVHDGVNRYDYVIDKVFDNNLPTKYMQHFPILRMDKDENGWGEHIWFEGGLEVFFDQNGKRTMTKDGKTIYNQDSYLIPWDEGDMQVENSAEQKEVKLYHWNETAGATTWELPESWAGLASVYLYKLTDQGKTEQVVVPVQSGKVTLNAEAKTPYVVYKGEAAPTEDVAYGDGNFVKDPGFNYGDLRAWTVTKGNPEVHRNDTEFDAQEVASRFGSDLRNYELVIDGSEEAEVSQTITGLVPGEEYAASVMVEVQQGKTRKASLFVDCGDITVSNYTDKSILKQYDAYDSKATTYMLRMRVVFQVPEGQTTATVRLHTEAGEGKVRFDNVRVYDTTTPAAPEGAKNVVLYQDFEYGIRANAPEREQYKATFESYYPFNLGYGGGYREARAMLQTRHDPYTQNNQNAGWDADTIMVDMALDGNHSLSVITGSSGAAFQTSPQTVRFEEGRKYRVSFLYQEALDKTFAFVLGEDNERNVLFKEALDETPAKTGSKTYTHEFTSTSDQTWFAIHRVDTSVSVSDNPNPFVIDNILVEDITEDVPPTEYAVAVKADEGAEVKASAEKAAEGDTVTFTAALKAEAEGKVLEVKVLAGETPVAFEKQADGSYAFEMPAGDVSIVVTVNEKAIDYTWLKAAIQVAESKAEADYTAESWAAFRAVLADAKAKADPETTPDATQQMLDQAAQALMEAAEALEPVGDKAALQAMVNALAAKAEADYTPETWGPFAEALANANTALSTPGLSQQMLDGVAEQLKAAAAALVPAAEGALNTAALEAAIARAEALVKEEYTTESWNALETALAAAKALLNPAPAQEPGAEGEGEAAEPATGPAASIAALTQEDIDAACAALNTAIANLVKVDAPADPSALNAALAEAKAKDPAAYTEESWAPVADAIAKAEEILAGAASQSQLDAAQALLQNAVAGLVEKPIVKPVEKKELKAALDDACARNEAEYTEESWAALAILRDKAEKVYNDPKATQEQVDDAAAKLNEALAALAPKPAVNKDALRAAIADAQSRRQEEYTTESWNDMQTALSAAITAEQDPHASQTRVNEAAAELNAKLSALQKRPVADKNALNDLVNALKDKANDDYTDESWSAFQRALLAALDGQTQPYISQADVDRLVRELNEANSALTKKSESKPDDSSSSGTPDASDNSQSGDSGSGSGTLPATGDTSPVLGWFALFTACLAAAGILLALLAKKRRKDNF